MFDLRKRALNKEMAKMLNIKRNTLAALLAGICATVAGSALASPDWAKAASKTIIAVLPGQFAHRVDYARVSITVAPMA